MRLSLISRKQWKNIRILEEILKNVWTTDMSEIGLFEKALQKGMIWFQNGVSC